MYKETKIYTVKLTGHDLIHLQIVLDSFLKEANTFLKKIDDQTAHDTTLSLIQEVESVREKIRGGDCGNECLRQVKGDNMKIPSNRFKFWWNLGVVHSKGHLLTFAVSIFICGLIVGLALLLAVQSYQLQALRKLPVNLKGVAYAEEQTIPKP